MKKTLLSLATLLTSITYAHEDSPPLPQDAFLQESPYTHILSPVAFWRSHNETGYKYKTFGGGVQYHLYRPLGFNFSVSALTNGSFDHQLVESCSQISFKFSIAPTHAIYPLFSSKSASHKVKSIEEQSFYVNKSTIFGGIGWEGFISNFFCVQAELAYFRDLHNALLVQEPDHFWGKTYTNPQGVKGMINAGYALTEKVTVNASSYYARTLCHCYRELGLSLSANWVF